MSESDHIQGGYILIARQMLDSDVMDMPAHYVKLWIWMLNEAMWKDGSSLRRGQLVTTIADMQKVGGHLVGYRRVDLTKDQVRSCYEALTKQQMITTAKTTRGLVITICNYERYQCPENYEAHAEALKQPTRTPQSPHTIDEEREEGKKETLKPVAESAPRKQPTAAISDEDWLLSLKADPAYAGIDVDREIAKCGRWCDTNRKQRTRKRIINWLNRADVPVAGVPDVGRAVKTFKTIQTEDLHSAARSFVGGLRD